MSLIDDIFKLSSEPQDEFQPKFAAKKNLIQNTLANFERTLKNTPHRPIYTNTDTFYVSFL